ncbi:hypothetical protein HOLleu_17549 [Holothuria leucospilota]|uniref:Uncharacterized protein n=1 Tax=Holothuria leucospilota TaxID=206669 RepID=A0A9Q1C2P1_HOLLE|nr:hypothetical protein HOLleu_17549 [Holothuria leucospilota]
MIRLSFMKSLLNIRKESRIPPLWLATSWLTPLHQHVPGSYPHLDLRHGGPCVINVQSCISSSSQHLCYKKVSACQDNRNTNPSLCNIPVRMLKCHFS